MTRLSRNSPCPCGSGKKYKQCCLLRDQERASQTDRQTTGVRESLAWLVELHQEEMKAALEQGFLSDLTQDQKDRLGQLSDEAHSMFHVNASEWLLAEGGTVIEGVPARFADLVLGEGGPRLSPEQRDTIRMMAEEPLGLYEVADAKPNEGLWVIDTLTPNRETTWVREKTASRNLRPGDVFAARILPTDPKVLSGAVYPFSRGDYLRLRGDILEVSKKRRGLKMATEPARVSACIRRHWVSALAGPPIQIVDGFGEPVQWTTFHYRVKDWERLQKALESQPDVIGDADEGWSRLQEPEADLSRTLYSLRRVGGGQLDLFAMTPSRARKAEQWLTEIAGESVERLAGRVTDPRLVAQRSEAHRTRQEGKEELLETLSDEERKALFEKLVRHVYRTWADDPIPALGGKTPRQAVKTKAGKREVVKLLRSYTIEERRRAAKEGRDAVDLGFLWKQVGLREGDHLR